MILMKTAQADEHVVGKCIRIVVDDYENVSEIETEVACILVTQPHPQSQSLLASTNPNRPPLLKV